MSNACISRALLNHAAALVQAGNDPESYAHTMHDLGSHHARDEHQWADGHCNFHNIQKEDGTDYHTTHPLRCEFHARARG